MMLHDRYRLAHGGGREDGPDVPAEEDRAARRGVEPEGDDAIGVGVGAVELVLAPAEVAGAEEGGQISEQPVGVGNDGEAGDDGLLDELSSPVAIEKQPKDQGGQHKTAAQKRQRCRRSLA